MNPSEPPPPSHPLPHTSENNPAHPAFPTSLAQAVSRLCPILLSKTKHESRAHFEVSCAGETLLIPGRIYFAAPSGWAFRALHPAEQLIVACWFTRHHDGHVRERFLLTLTAFDRPWVIAYVVKLCGEYVIELLHYIWERREFFDELELGRWLRDNPAFYHRIRSQIVSYWDCYYRSSFPNFDDYIGSHLLSFFDASIQHSQSTPSA